MTLKQEQVIANLPKNGYNLSKTMREAGYTDSTSRSGQQYERIRKKVAKYYDPEQIKADIQAVRDKAMAKDDLTCVCRLLELQSRIMGLLKPDTNTNQTNIIGDEAIKGMANRVNVSETPQKLDIPDPDSSTEVSKNTAC